MSITPPARRAASLALSLALAGAALFSSCLSGRGRGVVRILLNSGVAGDAMKMMAGEYERLTRVRVQITALPYAKLSERLHGPEGELADFDVVMLDDPWFPALTEGHKLKNLEPLMASDDGSGGKIELNKFVDKSLALCRSPYAKGTLYALPFMGNSQLYSYNDKLFADRGLNPPSTWDEVKATAQQLKSDNVAGYVMRASGPNSIVTDFLPIFWAYDANMFDERGRITVNSPQAREALLLMIELGKYAPDDYLNFDDAILNTFLLEGKAAQGINWGGFILRFRDDGSWQSPPAVSFSQLPGLRPGEHSTPVIGNWLIAIPEGRRDADARAAFEFMKWVTAAEQMKQTALRGTPPTRRDVFEDKQVQAVYPYFATLYESLTKSRARDRTPMWSRIEGVFGKHLIAANEACRVEGVTDEAKRQIVAKELDAANAEIETFMEGSP